MQNRIKELRKKHDLTLLQLGEIVGCAESTMSHYESGRRRPSFETLTKLSKYFDVSIGYLIGTEQEESFKNTPDSLESERSEVIKIFENLPDSAKDQALKFLRFLSSQEDNK